MMTTQLSGVYFVAIFKTLEMNNAFPVTCVELVVVCNKIRRDHEWRKDSKETKSVNKRVIRGYSVSFHSKELNQDMLNFCPTE